LAVIGEYLFASGGITCNEVDATVNLESPQPFRDVLPCVENFLKAMG
jgi:hypothetical protein